MYPFSPGSFAPRNGWYVAAFIEEIGAQLLERWILNVPVVLYRTSDGIATALNGRCPHRHFPLAKSKRVGDAIQCGYHSITFDAGGKCTFVPSQSSIPGVYSIPAYPLVERGIWAWIWMGDPDKADESLIPTLDEIGYHVEGLTPTPLIFEHVKGRYQLLNDNLLDLSHLSYLHGTSIGTVTDAATPEVRDVTERRLYSSRTMPDTDLSPVMQSLTDYRGKVNRMTGMAFHAPGFHAGLAEEYVVESDPRAGEAIHIGRVWHAVTPATTNTTNYFFAITMRDPAQVERSRETLRPVLAEDVFATEEIEKIIAGLGEEALPKELMIKSDQTAVMGRRIMQAMMDRERAEETA